MKEISSTIIICLILLITISTNSTAQVNLAKNRAAYQSSAIDYNQTAHLATDGFMQTNWQSKQENSQWMYIDLGAVCQISNLNIHWGEAFATKYSIEIASEGEAGKNIKWTSVYSTSEGKGIFETIKIGDKKARFIKVSCTESANNNGFMINEIQVLGKGGIVLKPQPMPVMLPNGDQHLSGGNWKLQKALFVDADAKQISTKGFNDNEWIQATVPGTVLTSYYNIGAVPDHNFGDQQLMISESFFTADFWYRNQFVVPKSYEGKRIWINFKGINYQAEIYLNSNYVGEINGAFTRGKFDITHLAKPGEENVLAVLIKANEYPGEVTEQHLKDPDGNGGIIGFDGPTFLASIGWNWMPTIRGRNTGIWNDVFLSVSESVTIENPYIITDFKLPDTTKSIVTIETNLTNHTNETQQGILKGRFGDVTFEQPFEIPAKQTQRVILSPKTHPHLMVNNPKLWWPNGYGEQNLYNLELEFNVNGNVSDRNETTFGFRKYSYSYENNHLRISINGHPLIIRGGNWGMPEAMLRCDKEGYDLRVRLHKEMNMNMIRNWIGMTAHKDFYDACDKYGIMIWDDFWLANPVDGPHPKDNKLFMDNVTDKVLRRRNHASLALWCGRNEGYPPAVLDSSMRRVLEVYDNTRHYISSSADRPATGLGPYETKDPIWYFTQRGTTFHSEQGIVCVPQIESIKEMMPEENLWPINNMWGKHDWTQERVQIFTDDMIKNYGEPNSLEDFCTKAQMLNMEGPKAMFESWQSNRGPGVILWMSHPAWPSLICQTYDYYFEPTAAYFAIKNASEPLHIMWRADNDKVQVANNLRKSVDNVTVIAKLYNFDGTLAWTDSLVSNIKANSINDFFTIDATKSSSGIQFIKLNLKNNIGEILSENFYWRGNEYLNYKSLNELPEVNLRGDAAFSTSGRTGKVTVTITNPTNEVALMCRVKLLQKDTEKRVLPAFYSDNYVSLLPGDQKTIEIEFDTIYLEEQKPHITIEGLNIMKSEIRFIVK